MAFGVWASKGCSGLLKVAGGGGAADNAKRPMVLGEGGDMYRQVGNATSCEAEQGIRWGQLGGQCEIMRAENPECTGRAVGDKCDTNLNSCGQRIESVAGDSWETSAQLADQSAQSIHVALGNKWRQVDTVGGEM